MSPTTQAAFAILHTFVGCWCMYTVPVLKAGHPGVPSYYVCLSGLWLGGLLYLSYFHAMHMYFHVHVHVYMHVRQVHMHLPVQCHVYLDYGQGEMRSGTGFLPSKSLGAKVHVQRRVTVLLISHLKTCTCILLGIALHITTRLCRYSPILSPETTYS